MYNFAKLPGRIALQLALYNPDIISLSEGPERSIAEMIAHWLGMNYVYFLSSKYKGSFPGAIFSRYDIVSFKNRPFVGVDSKDLFTRHWGKVILRLPASGELIAVHSAHLWYKDNGEGTKVRLNEIKELHRAINDDLKHNVKSVILQGDLNHKPGSPEYNGLKEGGMVDLFKMVGQGEGYTHNAMKPGKRIDYIL